MSHYVWVIVFTIVSLCSGAEIKTADLLAETQKMSRQDKVVRFAWWIPEEFWKTMFSKSTTVREAQLDSLIFKIHPYTIFFVVNGKISSLGSITYSDYDELGKDIMLKTSGDHKYLPVARDQLDQDVKNLLDMMKPLLANMLGPMGQNMHYIVFKSEREGLPLFSSRENTQFSIRLSGEEFSWKLPLVSMMPKMHCSKCGGSFPGNYVYCPFDGTKLKPETVDK